MTARDRVWRLGRLMTSALNAGSRDKLLAALADATPQEVLRALAHAPGDHARDLLAPLDQAAPPQPRSVS